MSAPLPLSLATGSAGALALAFGVGIGFGWCLERAGLGSASKLMGQFHLTDLAVFKVMFSAIVTAMLGLFWLSRVGVVDLSRVYVPETFVLPQLVGGLVFGAGMALAGLCPGTSCVAAATGRGDGFVVVGGFFAGVLMTALALPGMARFYQSGARGTLTLDSVLGLETGSLILVVVAAALAGFIVAEQVEQWKLRRLAELER
ncbi:MAG: sulfurtransferase [Gemmatimonadetes bacterium]|nr:MAG: sulfurtransferase [Gemmatimonadota bacterium]